MAHEKNTLEFISCDVQSPHFSIEVCLMQYGVWFDVVTKSQNPETAVKIETPHQKIVRKNKSKGSIALLKKENATLTRYLAFEKESVSILNSVIDAQDQKLAEEKTRADAAEKNMSLFRTLAVFLGIAIIVLMILLISVLRKNNRYQKILNSETQEKT